MMSQLNINPWPILASTSAMLVSLSFAFGTSVSRYFDGMLLIVARRPYDLGDRIIINDPTANEYDARKDSWYVEDITLFTTTVRRGRDSTIATLNNSSIALLKIVNCARSPNAAVSLEMKFHMKMNEDGNINMFQTAVEEYLESNPRSWDSLKFLLLTELDTDNEHAIYQMTVIHRLGWQDAVRVAQSRAALVTFCFKAAKELGVQYSTPMPSRMLYHVQKKEGGENDATTTTATEVARPSGSNNLDDNAMISDGFIQ
jgi:Mechanosensitive ion channel